VPWSVEVFGFDERGVAVLLDWLPIARGQLPESLDRRRTATVTASTERY
jgi:hypothetical protein